MDYLYHIHSTQRHILSLKTVLPFKIIKKYITKFTIKFIFPNENIIQNWISSKWLLNKPYIKLKTVLRYDTFL